MIIFGFGQNTIKSGLKKQELLFNKAPEHVFKLLIYFLANPVKEVFKWQ